MKRTSILLMLMIPMLSFGTMVTNDFNTWGTNYYARATTYITFDQIDMTSLVRDQYSPVQDLPYGFWMLESFTVTGNRATNQSLGLRLEVNGTNKGKTWNSSVGEAYGVGYVYISSRMSVRDGYYSFYPAGLTNPAWAQPYHVTNVFRASDMSYGATNTSISMLMCLQRNATNAPSSMDSYYEWRLRQISGDFTDGLIELDLYCHTNGVDRLVQTTNSFASFWQLHASQQLTGTNPIVLDVSWTNDPVLGMVFSGSVYRVGYPSPPGTKSLIFDIPTNWIDALANQPLTNGGTVGFLCADTVPVISSIYVETNGVKIYDSADVGFGDWFMGGNRRDGQTRWQTNSLSLTRPITPSYLDVYFMPFLYYLALGYTISPVMPICEKKERVSINGLSFQSDSVWIRDWRTGGSKLQVEGEFPVVIQYIEMSPWRAYTRNYSDSNWISQARVAGVVFWNWISVTNQQCVWLRGEDGLCVTEGNVINNVDTNGNNGLSFIQSQASSYLLQGFYAPVITNIAPYISFHVFVDSGRSVYTVDQSLDSNPVGPTPTWNSWQTMQTFTNYAGDDLDIAVSNLTAYVGRGRVRVVQDNAASSNATLKIGRYVVIQQ